MLATNEELARKVAQHDRQIAVLFKQVANLLGARPRIPKNRLASAIQSAKMHRLSPG